MLSADDEQWKRLHDQHTLPRVGESTRPWDKEQWDRLHDQTVLLRERLLLAWETTLELLDQRYQIAQDHQNLRLQRQLLLEQQAAYLQDILPFY